MSFWSHLMNWEFLQAVVSGVAGGIIALLGNAALAMLKAGLVRKNERWAWFYAGRANAIKGLYARLASAEDALRHYVAQKDDGQLRDVAQSRRIKAHKFYQRKRIFFYDAERELIESCTGRNLDTFLNAMASRSTPGDTFSWGNEARKTLEETQVLLQQLDCEFRKALDIAKGHSMKGSS